MKIVTKGQLPGNKIYKCTCSNCRTFFEFEKQEAVIQYNQRDDQRDGDCLKIKCPLPGCDVVCWVNL